MYISEIIKYLLWPATVVLSWLIIKYAVDYFEKRQAELEEKKSAPGE